jgi:hypothetical protein
VIDLPARSDRSSTAFPSTSGPRLPSRLRGRRPLVVPPALGDRLSGDGSSRHRCT